MDILEAIENRHSVRKYKTDNIEKEKIEVLKKEIKEINDLTGLHIQLVENEKNAFSGFIAKYSNFKNVENYIAMVGKNSNDLDKLVGYYGEKLVILSQTMGLNTCWVGLKFITKHGKCEIKEDEKLVCIITVGYGETQGKKSRMKAFEKVVDVEGYIPKWFKDGVEAALLAPSAINQQKFLFTLRGNNVSLKSTGGVMSDVDLGIVKYHFEIGAGIDNFIWIK